MIHFIQQSCLEKIRADATEFKEPFLTSCALAGEVFAYQVAIYSDSDSSEAVSVYAESGAEVCLYEVKQVPVNWPHYANDSYRHYLTDTPALLPDALVPLGRRKTLRINRNVTVLWVEVTADFPGNYDVELVFKTNEGEQRTLFHLHILPCRMPELRFNLCQYIDPASIAAYYGVPMFCDKHWDLLEKNIQLAAKHGVTNLLTPIYPPVYGKHSLGGEGVQLVKITENKNDYEFNYDLLDCWVLFAKRNGIKRLTFPPIFPSIETLECPKIKITRSWREVWLFDESTDVLSPIFCNFIRKFFRSLMKHMKEIGAEDMMCFQISDRPSVEFADRYAQCRALLNNVINCHQIADIAVPYDFYKLNLGSAPFFTIQDIDDLLRLPSDRFLCTDVTAVNAITNFLIASPSLRVRTFGLLCFQYRIAALFNLWFNNYFNAEGERADVFLNTANENALPSGGGFLVYPGMDGPIPSIRLKQLFYALQDIQALRVLERDIPFDRVVSKISKIASVDTLTVSEEKFIKIRDEIYAQIEKFNNK